MHNCTRTTQHSNPSLFEAAGYEYQHPLLLLIRASISTARKSHPAAAVTTQLTFCMKLFPNKFWIFGKQLCDEGNSMWTSTCHFLQTVNHVNIIHFVPTVFSVYIVCVSMKPKKGCDTCWLSAAIETILKKMKNQTHSYIRLNVCITPGCLWSSTVIACTPVSPPAMGNMACVDSLAPFSFGSSCSFTCLEGYTLAGNRTLACLASGQWSQPRPTCTGRICYSGLEILWSTNSKIPKKKQVKVQIYWERY